MKIFQKATFAVAVSSLMVLANPAQAQKQRPPKPDMAEMAQAMGVPEDALKSCMGAKPQSNSSERSRPPRPDAAKISACLQDAGHEVTEEGVGETLKSFAPKRRSR